MATGVRKYVTMHVALWRDPEWTGLTAEAQWVYMLLITQRATSVIGTLPLTVRRWAGYSPDATPQLVRSALAELAEAGFAAADEATGEAWVWQAKRPCGLKHYRAALATLRTIESPAVRGRVTDWLGKFDPAAPSGRQARSGRFAAVRVEVYRRDGYACQSCSWSVEVPEGYDGSYALGVVALNDRGELRAIALELDHVYPKSLGGTFEVDNLQVLCSPCNARKGARV